MENTKLNMMSVMSLENMWFQKKVDPLCPPTTRPDPMKNSDSGCMGSPRFNAWPRTKIWDMVRKKNPQHLGATCNTSNSTSTERECHQQPREFSLNENGYLHFAKILPTINWENSPFHEELYIEPTKRKQVKWTSNSVQPVIQESICNICMCPFSNTCNWRRFLQNRSKGDTWNPKHGTFPERSVSRMAILWRSGKTINKQ